MQAKEYLDLIKLGVSLALLTLAALIAWTGTRTSTAKTLSPVSVESSPAAKRGKILREPVSRARPDPGSDFLDYETGSARAIERGR